MRVVGALDGRHDRVGDRAQDLALELVHRPSLSGFTPPAGG
jgi:hypothetical protein